VYIYVGGVLEESRTDSRSGEYYPAIVLENVGTDSTGDTIDFDSFTVQ